MHNSAIVLVIKLESNHTEAIVTFAFVIQNVYKYSTWLYRYILHFV